MKPKGTILLIGGAEDKGDDKITSGEKNNATFEHFEILKKLLPEKGRRKTIEIIATASDIPDEMNAAYKKAFAKIGFKNIGFMRIASKEEARLPAYAARVAKAHAVFFTGGNQFNLAALIGGTAVIEHIRDKYYRDPHFVVAGTSAGAMALSKIMMYEGGVNEALRKDDLRITSGLGIFDTLIIDTHFIKRGRFSRLANAIIMNPEALGIGLGEDTALIIRKGDIAECSGSGTVIVIDGNQIGLTNITTVAEDEPIFVENLRVHVVCKGCKFSILKRQMLPTEPAKRNKKQSR